MMLWRVTNLLATSVCIEDLGITLQARGGEDSSTTISDESKSSSRSIKNLLGAKWVSISPFSSSTSGIQKMPAWPFSKPTVSPEAPALVAPPSVSPDPVMLETMRRLEVTLSDLAAAIRNGPISSGPAPMSHSAPFTTEVIASAPSLRDPVYIPDSIVPKDAKTDIRIHTEESSADTLDSSVSSLKKLRKGK